MSRIKARDTKPEVQFRSLLHRRGYRFTVNGSLNRDLPGKPDIVLPKHNCVVFVHGCFWHQHNGCKAAKIPKTSSSGINWGEKLAKNQQRDELVQKQLKESGWNVFVAWECEINKTPEDLLKRFTENLKKPPNKTSPLEVS